MKIYIICKITGLPVDEAKAMFQAAEDHLLDKYKSHDAKVINPFKIDHSEAERMQNTFIGDSDVCAYSAKEIWVQYMKEDLGALLNCSGIFMLKNWGQSQRARIEYATAREMGFAVEHE